MKGNNVSRHSRFGTLYSLERMPLRLEAMPPQPLAERLDVASIHDDHAEFVWVSLQRLGVPTYDAEDLLQEVFIVVHQRLHSFDHSSRITTWLFGICLRVVSAYRRRAHRRREQSVAQVPEERTLDEASPEQAAVNRQAGERLRAALDLMDLGKRAIFVMFEIDGLSCDDIAEMLSVPIGTVYSRLHSARSDFDRALLRMRAMEASRLGVRRGART